MPKLATRSWAVRRALAERRPFLTYGAFRAERGEPASRGRLPDEWWGVIRDSHRGRIVFTVYSYVTPIAWVLDDNIVVIPEVRYSITTSGHQGLLYALNQSPNSFPVESRSRTWAPTQAPNSWDWPLARPTADEPDSVPPAGSWYAPVNGCNA